MHAAHVCTYRGCLLLDFEISLVPLVALSSGFHERLFAVHTYFKCTHVSPKHVVIERDTCRTTPQRRLELQLGVVVWHPRV